MRISASLAPCCCHTDPQSPVTWHQHAPTMNCMLKGWVWMRQRLLSKTLFTVPPPLPPPSLTPFLLSTFLSSPVSIYTLMRARDFLRTIIESGQLFNYTEINEIAFRAIRAGNKTLITVCAATNLAVAEWWNLLSYLPHSSPLWTSASFRWGLLRPCQWLRCWKEYCLNLLTWPTVCDGLQTLRKILCYNYFLKVLNRRLIPWKPPILSSSVNCWNCRKKCLQSATWPACYWTEQVSSVASRLLFITG